MFQLVPNPVLDSICVIAVFFVAILNYVGIRKDKRGMSYVFFVILILLYSILYRPVGGDFWSYLESYRLGFDTNYRHMEDFYYWLMKQIPENYLLWRLAIWLPAAILIAWVFHLMKVPSNFASFFFILYGLQAYYYTRNALALSVLYFALAMICVYRTNKTNSSWIRALFIVLLIVSWFLHKSMPLYIVVGILALLLPFNRNYLVGALMVFPFLYGATLLISSRVLDVAGIWLQEGVGVNYLETENVLNYNFKGIVSMIIKYMPVLYFYIIAFNKPISKESDDFRLYKTFLLFSFFVTFVSFLFFGQGSSSIHGRLYKSSFIPFSMTVGLYFKHFWGTKRCQSFIYLTILYYLWSIFVELVRGL